MIIDSHYLENFKNENKIYNERLSEIKPVYRGWLHLKVSYLLLYIIVNLTVFIIFENVINYNVYIDNQLNNIIDNNRILLYFFILKLYSYGSSSLLHRYPFKNKNIMELTLMNDLVAISCSSYGTCIIFINHLENSKTYHYNNLYFILINILCILKDNKVLLSLWDMLRMINITFHCVYVLYLIGKIVNYTIYWKLTCINYSISFLLYNLKQINIKPMIWHKPLIYGFHEDFHLLLFIADTFVLISFIEYRYNSII